MAFPSYFACDQFKETASLNFDFSEEQKLLREQARRALAEDLEVAREVPGAERRATDATG